MRAYIAVDLEEEEIKKKIERLQEELEASGAIMKLVEPRNFHVTLKFLGEIDDSLVERIKEKLESLEASSFYAPLIGLGAFPHPSRPRVVFIDIPSQELSTLMEEIDRAMHSLGFELERRGYKPHLTIARVKAQGYRLKNLLRKYERYDFGVMSVKEIRLKKSTLTPEGPIYETLFSRKL